MGNFPITRLVELCNESSVLERIRIIRSYTFSELLQALEFSSQQQATDDNQVQLIVLDNVSVPFRTLRTSSVSERVEAIHTFGLRWRRLGHDTATTLVCTNHLTTKFLPSEEDNGRGRKAILVPALGENWAIMTDLQLLLEERSNGRTLLITRSDFESYKQTELSFQITVKNFRCKLLLRFFIEFGLSI